MASGKEIPSELLPKYLDRSDSQASSIEGEEKPGADANPPVIPSEVARDRAEKVEAVDDGYSDQEEDEKLSRKNLPILLNFVTKHVLGALKGGTDFSIAHDVQAAGWFGDFVFRYPANNGKDVLHDLTCILGPSELGKGCDGCGEGQNKLTTSDLSSEQGPFALEKYLNSYLEIKKSDEFHGDVEGLTVITVGDGEALLSSDCLEQAEGKRVTFSEMPIKILKDMEVWRRTLVQKHEPELKKDVIDEFLEKLNFAEYTVTDPSELITILEEICPTQRPQTFYLMLKENLEEWITSEEGKYLTANEIRCWLDENGRLLDSQAQLQAVASNCSVKD